MTIKHTPGPWKWKWGEGEVSGIPRLYAGKEIIMEGSLDGFLMGEPRIVLNGDHAKGNAKLISQAAVSPHECLDPECPGNKNRRKLEIFDQMVKALPYALPDCQLTSILRSYAEEMK